MFLLIVVDHRLSVSPSLDVNVGLKYSKKKKSVIYLNNQMSKMFDLVDIYVKAYLFNINMILSSKLFFDA